LVRDGVDKTLTGRGGDFLKYGLTPLLIGPLLNRSGTI
jgi:hypothetical protein